MVVAKNGSTLHSAACLYRVLHPQSDTDQSVLKLLLCNKKAEMYLVSMDIYMETRLYNYVSGSLTCFENFSFWKSSGKTTSGLRMFPIILSRSMSVVSGR